jgi:hypothetical protein
LATFISDGTPYHIVATSSTKRTILYLEATLSVQTHVLNAYDRDYGPDVVVGKSVDSHVAGYLILDENDSTFGVSTTRWRNGEDPTSADEGALPGGSPLVSSSSSFSGVFLPASGSAYSPQVPVFRAPDPSPSFTFTAGMGAFTGPGGTTWGSWAGPQ